MYKKCNIAPEEKLPRIFARLIHSSSDLPRSDCAANNSFNGVILEDLLEQERKMEITIDETVANITSTEDYDNDNGNNNDDESKRNDQIPGVSTSPLSITDILADNGSTRLGSYEVPPPLAPSTKDPPGGGLSMNLNHSTINAAVPFAEGSASGNQGIRFRASLPAHRALLICWRIMD